MNLSICIPTYNRCEYLKKNLILLISQIRQYGLNNRVQICISNNCSTDGTDQMIKLFVTENKDISIIYSCNKENLGADKNFIAVMKMAMFEYSILLGDDDYFKDGALKQIFDIIEPLRFVDIFLSNRTEILTDGTFFRDRKFLNCESCLFDFSNKQDINLYFHSVATLGGALCFISSVIYKTEIVVGDFDKRFYGTQYAFLYYFWGKLLNGGKLKYNNVSYLYSVAGGTNNNYGKGVKRAIVDYSGFYKYGNVMFKDTDFYYSWIKLPNIDCNWYKLSLLYITEKEDFETKLEPYLIQAGWNSESLNQLKRSVSLKSLLRILFRKCCSASIRNFFGFN